MKKFLIISLLIFAFVFTFHVSEATAINSTKWNLYFDNIKVTEGSVNATVEPTITGESNTEVTYSVNLDTPGDFYEFTVDAVNGGSLDAMLSEINVTELTDNQKKYLDYEVTYMDGTQIKQNDKLDAGDTEKLKVRLEFKKDIIADDLPKEDNILMLSLNAYYVQADSNANEPEHETTNDNVTENANENAENPKTGDGIINYVVLLVISLVSLVIIRKKLNKADEN